MYTYDYDVVVSRRALVLDDGFVFESLYELLSKLDDLHFATDFDGQFIIFAEGKYGEKLEQLKVLHKGYLHQYYKGENFDDFYHKVSLLAFENGGTKDA